MKHALYILPILLAACSAPQEVTSQHTKTIAGNPIRFTSGNAGGGRFVVVENADKHWQGSLKGGKEQWNARADLLYNESREEIRTICGEWFYELRSGPLYNMMDKDDTMGGMAPVLGITASMVAHLAAASATDEANIPVSARTEFRCRRDADGT